MSVNADREAWVKALRSTLERFREHTFVIVSKTSAPSGQPTVEAIVAVAQRSAGSLTVEGELSDPRSEPAIALKYPNHGRYLLWRDQLWDLPEADWHELVNPGVGRFSKFTLPLIRRTAPRL